MAEDYDEQARRVALSVYEHILEASGFDYLSALQAIGLVMGRLIVELPEHYREPTIKAIVRDARDVIDVANAAGIKSGIVIMTDS